MGGENMGNRLTLADSETANREQLADYVHVVAESVEVCISTSLRYQSQHLG